MVNDQFNEQGFLVLENYLTKEEQSQLISECKRFEAENNHPVHIFKQCKEYFLASSDKVHYFYEDDGKTLNKIGHGLNFHSKVIHDLSERIKNEFTPNSRVLQTMFILKSANVGGEVVPHQDSTFLYTEPLSTIGFWIPLDDCTLENGCLQVIPGSHKLPVTSRFVHRDGKLFIEGESVFPEEGYVPLLVKKGSLVIIHGSIVHKSELNTSPHSRLAFTFHTIDNNAFYPKENWLQ